MKENIIRNTAKGLLAFTVLTVLVLLNTGSSALAVVTDNTQPGIDVVDKRGVGQTKREIENGMNDEVIYDPETKTLTWNVGDNYQLMEEYTYYITFKVKDGELIRTELKR